MVSRNYSLGMRMTHTHNDKARSGEPLSESILSVESVRVCPMESESYPSILIHLGLAVGLG